MESLIVSPCGLVCNLCLGFQRSNNTCVGCNESGYKPNHCVNCSIIHCPEKLGDPKLLCNVCEQYPCRRLKDIDKRYRTKYGESLVENFIWIERMGMTAFKEELIKYWTCSGCGELLCAHRDVCLHCGAPNPHFHHH
jgi:ribosomal protein L32